MTTIHDDLMAPEVIVDPHTYYRRLLEAEPIHYNAKWGGWVLTRYDDVVQVLRDHHRFSSDRMGFLAKELSEEKRGDVTYTVTIQLNQVDPRLRWGMTALVEMAK